MKMADAKRLIAEKHLAEIGNQGYMVHFSRRDGCLVRGDYFPDKHSGEALIPTEAEAWRYAWEFANATTPDIIDIYVVDHSWKPVPGYRERMLKAK